jgi:AraC-like DNA-binding protein
MRDTMATSPSTARFMNPSTPPVHPHAALVEQACRAMESGAATDLATLAEQAGMSRFHFHRVFKAVTGITPKAYAKAVRASRARQELDHGRSRGRSVTDAIYEAGFNSSGRFYESVPAMLGMTPTEFRRGGAGVGIRFAVAQCSLGALLVAATEKGICQITLGDDPQALVRGLQDRFSQASLEGGGCARHRFPATCLASPVRDPSGQHRLLCGGRPPHRRAGGRTRGGARLRQQRHRAGHPLPSCRANGRRPGRLPLGRRAQAGVAGARGRPATVSAISQPDAARYRQRCRDSATSTECLHP